MTMHNHSFATFTHPAWVQPILPHVPAAVDMTADGLRLPLVRCRFPVRHFTSMLTSLTPGGLPWCQPGTEKAAAAHWLASLGAPVVLRDVRMDHPLAQTFIETATHKHILKTWERGAIRLQGSFSTWMQENFDHLRRKEIKRRYARLSETGNLQVRRLQRNEDPQPFIDAFLLLEHAGWKGERGSSIKTVPWETDALTQSVHAMHKAGRLLFWLITLNDKPVAALFALEAGNEVHLGKIAHHPDWSKYSPGVLIVVTATEDLFGAGRFGLADSNAVPGHPMIERLWRDRVPCADIVLAGSGVGAAQFRLLTQFVETRTAIRNSLKRLIKRGAHQ